MILLIGSEGNMGKRYKAILKHLNLSFLEFDVKTHDDLHLKAVHASKFIIATPTETHFALISELAIHQKPILCEKPITKDHRELSDLLAMKVNLKMINQYAYLYDQNSKGPTEYDYYRHGADGLHWDCLNILGLAKHQVVLKETSPMWHCVINGTVIRIEDMDEAYIEMIEDWNKNPVSDMPYIEYAHKKVLAYEKN